jgi:hypothetical protein
VTKRSRIVLAILVGSAVAAIPALLQSHFKAGSFPDLICEMCLLPGKVIATLFHDRGSASPEFLWRTRAATAIFFGVLAYGVLHYRKQPQKSSR